MGDLTKGKTFTSGEEIDHTDLNNLVDDATVNATLISGKSLASSPAQTDQMLLYNSAELRRVTLQTMVFDHTNLLNARSELSGVTAVAKEDNVLLADASDSSNYKRATLQNAVFDSDELIANRTEDTTPDGDDEVLIKDTGASTYKRVKRTNLIGYQWYSHLDLNDTGMDAMTAPIGSDVLPIRDVTAVANKRLTLDNLVTGQAAIGEALADDDEILVYNESASAPKLRKADVSAIYTYINSFISIAKAASDGSDAVPAQNNSVGWAWVAGLSLAGKAQQYKVVLLCQTGEHGYSAGDEVDLNHVMADSYTQAFAVYANATGVYAFRADYSAMYIISRATGAAVDIESTKTNWRMKVYAQYQA